MKTYYYDQNGKQTGYSERKTFVEEVGDGVDDVCHFIVLAICILVFMFFAFASSQMFSW